MVGEMGFDRDEVLAQLNLTQEQMSQPDARLTHDQGRAFVRRMRQLTGKAELGLLVAERSQLCDLDLLGYMMRCSDSLLSGLDAVVRYGRLLGDTAAFGMERRGAKVTLSLGLSGGHTFEPEAADCLVAIMFLAVRELSGGTALPLEVRLPRQRPRCAQFFRRWFGAPVLFGAACAQLTYAKQSLSSAPAQRDPRLARLLGQQAEAVLDALPETNNLLDRVRSEIARALADGAVSLPRIARGCGLSDRTLRRRVHGSGLRFRELVEEVRREHALTAIEGADGVTAIALQLGYRDPSSFSRAFRRWTGVTPQSYRNR
jgi:AraC-like DNA-binding protein